MWIDISAHGLWSASLARSHLSNVSKCSAVVVADSAGPPEDLHRKHCFGQLRCDERFAHKPPIEEGRSRMGARRFIEVIGLL